MVHDVGGQLRRTFLQHILHPVHNLGNGRIQGFADLLRSDLDILRQPCQQIPAADIHPGPAGI